MTYKSIAILGLGCALLAGCGTGDRVRDIYEERRADSQVESGELAPGEVYSATKALNEREIQAIGVAKGRLDDPGVVAFADKVEQDHRAILEKLEGIGSESEMGEGVTPHEGRLTREIKDEGDDAADDLGDVRGDDLDEKFIDTMVDDHERALDIIDRQLLPSASGELLQVISEMRQHVIMHLNEAKEIKDGLD